MNSIIKINEVKPASGPEGSLFVADVSFIHPAPPSVEAVLRFGSQTVPTEMYSNEGSQSHILRARVPEKLQLESQNDSVQVHLDILTPNSPETQDRMTLKLSEWQYSSPSSQNSELDVSGMAARFDAADLSAGVSDTASSVSSPVGSFLPLHDVSNTSSSPIETVQPKLGRKRSVEMRDEIRAPYSSQLSVGENTPKSTSGRAKKLSRTASAESVGSRAPQPRLVRASTLNQNNGEFDAQMVSLIMRPRPDCIEKPFQSLHWTKAERQAGRRLFKFWRRQDQTHVYATFTLIPAEDYIAGQCVVSCILDPDDELSYISSVDVIALTEMLIGHRFCVEEKNRIRRNLASFKPLTIGKSEHAALFDRIMNFDEPRPRNIEKEIKVFRWSDVPDALDRVVSKFCVDEKTLLL